MGAVEWTVNLQKHVLLFRKKVNIQGDLCTAVRDGLREN